MDLDNWIAIADRLVDEPFPARRERRDDGFSEPGLHVAELATSRDFWGDDAYAAMESTFELYQGMRGRLTESLALRWGDPEYVDLSEALDRALTGEELSPAIEYLCDVASGHAPRWQVGRRSAMLAVAWADKELPMILTLAIGETQNSSEPVTNMPC